jgi:hypothetical protein
MPQGIDADQSLGRFIRPIVDQVQPLFNLLRSTPKTTYFLNNDRLASQRFANQLTNTARFKGFVANG